MFSFVRRRRREALAAEPFPEDWAQILRKRAPFYAAMQPELLARFHGMVRAFEEEKHFIGARDLEPTLEHRVVISAVAVRLVVHLDLDYYDRLTEIVIYPFDYVHPGEDGTMVFGEAHDFGTVVLSWPAVLRGLSNPCDGHDTASHEFAHALDRDGGRFNGTPRLRATEDYRAWGEVMSHHFERLREGDPVERSVLRAYGATNEAEFFAVATESFFERSVRMKEHTPDLYEALSRFYGFDPAQRPLCPGSSGH